MDAARTWANNQEGLCVWEPERGFVPLSGRMANIMQQWGTATYDPSVKAMYLKVQKGPIVDTDMVLPGIIVDFGEAGQVVGIEWLFTWME